ncbi:MAG: hypothetical protein V4617_11085 [Gemmatimonadota bacterium]
MSAQTSPNRRPASRTPARPALRVRRASVPAVHGPVQITRDATVEVRCASPRSARASRHLEKVVEQLAAALKLDVDVERGREESTPARTVWFVNGEQTAAESFLAVVRLIAAAHRGTVLGATPAPRIHARVVSSGAFFHRLP